MSYLITALQSPKAAWEILPVMYNTLFFLIRKRTNDSGRRLLIGLAVTIPETGSTQASEFCGFNPMVEKVPPIKIPFNPSSSMDITVLLAIGFHTVTEFPARSIAAALALVILEDVLD